MIGDVSLSIKDRARLRAVLDLFVKKLRGNISKAVEKTAVRVIFHLRTATKVSPKKRTQIVTNPRQYSYAKSGKFETREWALKRWRGKPLWTPIPLDGETKQEAREDAEQRKKDVIKKSGLAKLVWVVALGKLGTDARAGALKANVGMIRPGSTEIRTGKGLNSYYVKIHNRLPYCVSALKHGRSSVSEAIGAAYKSLEYRARNGIRDAKKGTKL